MSLKENPQIREAIDISSCSEEGGGRRKKSLLFELIDVEISHLVNRQPRGKKESFGKG